MPKFYATRDSDADRISPNAEISVFTTLEAAKEWLMEPLVNCGDDYDLGSAEIGPGDFGDCWIKSVDRPKIGTRWLSPFSYTQLRIERPGQHPGGKFYWTTPTVDVLVVADIRERDHAG